MPAKKDNPRKCIAECTAKTNNSRLGEYKHKWHHATDITETGVVAKRISLVRERFAIEELWFGHGTDIAVDEAAELVFFAAGLRHDQADEVYDLVLKPKQRAAALQLSERRIRERIPAAYLTHRMWFAGHEFYVDE